MSGGNSISRPATTEPGNKSATQWKRIVLALGAAMLLVVGLNVWKLTSSTSDEPQVAADQDATAADQADTSAPKISLDDLVARASEVDGSWIAAVQDDFAFTLEGVVNTEAARQGIEASLAETYGEFATSDIAVDANAGTDLWPSRLPALIQEGAAQFIDGGFAVNDQETYIVGTVPKGENIDRLRETAIEVSLPKVEEDVEIVDLLPPRVVAISRNGKLVIDGNVPDQKLINSIGSASAELYGGQNVDNNLSVNTNTFARFAFIRWGENLETFLPFKDFTLAVENEQLSSEVSGGVVFETNSSVLSEEGKRLLAGVPDLVRRANGSVDILGHTDNRGSPIQNLDLSRERAQAVKDFFVEEGLDPEIIGVIPKGDRVPIASNDTPEGQERNRRVQIVILPRG